MSGKKRVALNCLHADEDTVALAADKGSAVLTLNSTMHKEKMEGILNDPT